ncbi:unnamed protein product [Ectocarpus sp. 8 AP-2014]
MKIRQVLFLVATPGMHPLAAAAAATVTPNGNTKTAGGDRNNAGEKTAPTAAGVDGASRAHPHLGSLASDLDACSTEASSCLDDEVCLECMTSYVDHPLEYQSCLDNYVTDWASATVCDGRAEQPCCANFVSEGNCLENEPFTEYWKCNLGLFDGCVDYDMTCLGTEGMTEDLGLNASTTSTTSTGTSASSSTSIVSDAAVEDVATDESGAARKTFVVANVVVATASALLAGIAAVGLRRG